MTTTTTYAEWEQHRSCGRKQRYAHKLEANMAALQAFKRGANVHPYRCEHCDGWHLTKRRQDPP